MRLLTHLELQPATLTPSEAAAYLRVPRRKLPVLIRLQALPYVEYKSAARAAARAAAGDAARAATWDRLAPTVEALQASALKLLERLIEVTA